MIPAIVEFTARGSAQAVSAAIEAYAAERRVVTALVVPWESDAATLRMAVTSTKSDGWAIEHTNLGTISLADLGGERTRVAVLAAPVVKDNNNTNRELDLHDEQRKLLTAFARQLERKFGTVPVAPVAPGASVPPGERGERGEQ
jgi:hypothetical protein